MLVALVDDPENNIVQEQDTYRNFLRSQARFSNPMLIESQSVLHRIEFSYRLAFMKDTAAARWIDENTLNLISSVGHAGHHASRC